MTKTQATIALKKIVRHGDYIIANHQTYMEWRSYLAEVKPRYLEALLDWRDTHQGEMLPYALDRANWFGNLEYELAQARESR